jgi:uncharacterized membrane protein YgcG
MFSALLGYNPVQNMLAPYGVLKTLPAHNVAVLTGRQFFPNLITAPFHHGLIIVFIAAASMSVIGALVSLLRGKQFYYDDTAAGTGPALAAPAASPENTTSPNGHGRLAAGNGLAGGNGAVGGNGVADGQDSAPGQRARGR